MVQAHKFGSVLLSALMLDAATTVAPTAASVGASVVMRGLFIAQQVRIRDIHVLMNQSHLKVCSQVTQPREGQVTQHVHTLG